jgi:hypothetical protein
MRESGAPDPDGTESGRCPVHAANTSAAARTKDRRMGRIVIIQQ